MMTLKNHEALQAIQRYIRRLAAEESGDHIVEEDDDDEEG